MKSSRSAVIKGGLIGAGLGAAALPLAGAVIINAVSGNPFGAPDAVAGYLMLAVKGALAGGAVGAVGGAVLHSLRH